MNQSLPPDDAQDASAEDHPLSEVLIAYAKTFHSPPRDVPREAMWSAIAVRRSSHALVPSAMPGTRQAPRGDTTHWRWVAGLAAALVLGVALGRGWPRAARTVEVAAVESASPAVRAATREHLAHAEMLLTSFRADGAAPGTTPAVGPWARDLLTSTRLLLDAPGTSDPRERQLLSDLEMVLAALAQLEATRSSDDRVLVRDAIERRNLIPRLRTITMPADAMPAQHGTDE